MKRGRAILFIFLFSSLALAGALTYKRWPQLWSRPKNQPAVSSSSPNELVSIPPFSTKEPDRYQAIRITTSVENSSGATVTRTSKVMIARDGERRREEYVADAGGPATSDLVYLETPAGRFVLAPAKKLYADLDLSSPDSGSVTLPEEAGDFSPERLLHQTASLARYEKLGSETINERATTKYRVTSTDVGSVTLIWIDDSLGIPLRSETSSTEGEHSAKVIVELHDLKETVAAAIFELPADYRKVDFQQLTAGIRQNGGVTSGGQPGSEKP